MKQKLLFLSLAITAGISQIGYSQLVDGHAYMVGDFVEVGINADGYEGAPCIDGLHCRGADGTKIGFVSNPQEDGWVEFNGDHFIPGSPENGMGFSYTLDGDTIMLSNNAIGLAEIPGSITDYYDTVDSTIVTWDGAAGDLEIQIVYELQKDQHFYTTTVNLNNAGTETYTDVLYYRNLDADNNQSIGWSFVTDNEIVSQSGMADDSVIVSASQVGAWTSDFLFEAHGTDWRAFTGGFSNRNAWEMWLGTGALTTTEGYTATLDQSIGLVHKTDEILPGKAMAESFSFASVFREGAVQEANAETNGIQNADPVDFTVFPNPANAETVLITVEGTFTYSITDANGRVIAQGNNVNTQEINVEDWETGFYFVQIQQDARVGVQKLVVNH